MPNPVPHAQLDWDDQGRPRSRVFDDVYFSDQSGLDETRYVFIEQNRLSERFAELPAGERLVIGETGFGTGLNFLCAWQLFEQQAVAGARLHFISVEKYPLSPADMQRALTLWPDLKPFADQLLAQYVAIHQGFQRLVLDNGRVTLTLLIGDVLEQLPQLDAQIDAWFLDGFAPAKNPDMWTAELFAELARLSAPGSTISTFTSTGWVRRLLNAAGFKMRRTPGIGHKWEILRGEFVGWPQETSAPATVKPWFARPNQLSGERRALVIGAGLAGCASAASLAARGWQVSLLERHADLAQEASGNPQGVLYLKLSAHGTALSQLIVSGFGHTRRLLEHLQRGVDWDDCGVLQLAFNAKEAERQAQLAAAFPADLLHLLDQPHAQAQAGIELAHGGLFYPEGGWVHLPALCQWQASPPNVQLLTHRDVLELRKVDDQWQAWDGETLLASAPVVVLAGAAEIKRFAHSAELPLKRIRGQITRLAQTAESRCLATVVCAEGYVAPARLGEHTLGASFDFKSDDLTPTTAEHLGNLELLEEISSDLVTRLHARQLDPEQLQGRAAFRCTSPDYLPIVGPLADSQAFAQAYTALSKDARQVPDIACPWLDGLYINSGHGSRGLITAPLSGELLAAWLDNEPLPLPRSVAEACHPNRFALRKLIRGS
ncbi:bifunctional tRNA (5-methylaminomethyl-2-thiouridine)(34)-methyltransferase MnmD/FAD-dependent 5-carboxymethylaminomethyl-2-thiouridine(34) oxidoreductase MnmC [Pseudomonas sp. FW306-02-F02-AA]|uniref:bifunctional tRNA (5-methylaminomethyl-2-thiouridine)(34)-methyltransferase MnmD/FAD-dependent 5-carboxymethylaminomethyl-2-thiouridine(34) oxidoreductase MnmC n=1 Tax=Pseudomonas sp. FW306-2-11AD TaxID=2070665 RepID=UPI000C8884EF|nr:MULTISPECIES: bifunctional tRNA (5-methylaminomethyl-2-thiouridine)(34)-methyltransferase MnmD/FAD-dependent 5-carboxymethylaminomethyl-2-thiouridine(34) oxidoreductase MnmC [Pseudomonas]PMZ03200.1 bifunctional tRNA (5-methylaminomethyl-2-thiouridine)(34)-methyltransferase MnmD/FAD-dependent 5-carboxymethylaminomethyl-2-thiouridine(34) oxidoreductase MnmC [Pseudomonas sp. FW306-02-F02-AB]PMZ09035.1 bifunctional tRNA (5-methylaminomethyl-2-thiouridine)(34)-methyltransferase MnmD/FAD-dependent 5